VLVAVQVDKAILSTVVTGVDVAEVVPDHD
jgi:hypothetical protein